MPDAPKPTVVPEDELLPSVRELSRDQRLSKARNAAQSTILRKNRKEFDQEMAKEAAALGVEWTPRAATAEEKAFEEVEKLLEKYPNLREQVVDSILGSEHDVLRLQDDEEFVDGVSQRTGKPASSLTPAEEAALTEATAGLVIPSVTGAGVTARDVAGDSREAVAFVAGARRIGRATLDGQWFVYSIGGGDPRRVKVDGEHVTLIED